MSTQPTKPIPVAILVRVSTDKQENDRQLQELTQVATANGWTVTHKVEEKISGADLTRAKLQDLLTLAESGAIKKILVHEISRLSRAPDILHNAVERMTRANVSIYWHSQRQETLMHDGVRNPAAGMMLAILGENARVEREFLGARVKSGLERRRRAGKHLGRKKGSVVPPAEKLTMHADIAKLLRAGKMSIRQIAKQVEKAPGTVLMVKKLMAAPIIN